MSDIRTNTEAWLLAALAHNPDFLAKFWERLTGDAELWTPAIHKALFIGIRDMWTATGTVSVMQLARSLNCETFTSGQVLALTMDMTAQFTSDHVFDNELMALECECSLQRAHKIGEELAKATTLEHVRELSTSLQAALTPEAAGKHTIAMSDSYHKVLDQMQAMIDGNAPRGIATPFPTLTKLTGGAQPGQLWIISGETSDGKSMLAQNMVRNFLDAGKSTAIYSWEMPDDDITRRAVADVGNVSLGVFTGDSPMTNEAQDRIMSASRWMLENGKRNAIVDAAALSFHDVCADIRLKVLRDSISLVVIDYLQLMDLSDLDRSREQQVSKGCTTLYRLARSLNFTLIVLSQLNDEGKLRESRAPGMDCDKLITIQKVMNEEGESDETRRDIFLSKNRGGRRFVTIPCLFQGENARFRELDEHHAEESRKPTFTLPSKKKWSKRPH